jgi:hypothetical protein
VADHSFPYARNDRYTLLLAPLGIRSDDGVTVGDGRMTATFVRWSVQTPITNAVATSISGPHHWYTAVGLRLSFSDDGLTFGTDHHRGLCIQFEEKIHRVVGFRDHSSLWVSVADPEGLAAALE